MLGQGMTEDKEVNADFTIDDDVDAEKVKKIFNEIQEKLSCLVSSMEARNQLLCELIRMAKK